MARTREEFNAYISKHGGDPWKIRETWRHRQDSISFMSLSIPVNYTGEFLEFGAFNGFFTLELLREFPGSKIHAFEISDVAAQQMEKNLADAAITGVTLHRQDMMEIDQEMLSFASPPQILAIEVLYYLHADEREIFLHKLRKKFPDSPLYISCPITGGKYFTEESLIATMKLVGYSVAGLRTLNLRRDSQAPSFLRPFLRIPLVSFARIPLSFFSNHFGPIRRSCANQVIYRCVPV